MCSLSKFSCSCFWSCLLSLSLDLIITWGKAQISCISNCTQQNIFPTLQKPDCIVDQGFPNHYNVSISNLQPSDWFLGYQGKHSDFQEIIMIQVRKVIYKKHKEKLSVTNFAPFFLLSLHVNYYLNFLLFL